MRGVWRIALGVILAVGGVGCGGGEKNKNKDADRPTPASNLK